MGGGTYTETTTLTPDVAFLFGENNYIANLTLDNASIDVNNITISFFGYSYASECAINGDIVAQPGDYYLYGIYSGTGNTFTGDITVTNSNDATQGSIRSYVYGIYKSDNSTFTGDITADGGVYGIYDSDNSTFTGDITADEWVYGICQQSDNSTFTGDITAGGSVYGISDSDNSTFTGDITTDSYVYGICDYSDNSTFTGDITSGGSVYGIEYSDNSIFTGDITADGSYVYGIYQSDNSTFTGDITADADVYGIRDSDNSTFTGDITADADVYGIYSSDNSIFTGDIITADGDGHVNVYGIRDSDNSTFTGDITADGDGYVNVYGIFQSDNSTFTGDITVDDITVSGYVNVCGICLKSDNCTFTGDITADITGDIRSGYYVYVYGICNYSDNSTFTGDITADIAGDIASDASVHVYGILRSDNCSVTGTITKVCPEYTLTVTAASQFEGYYKCGHCGATLTSRSSMSYIRHCAYGRYQCVDSLSYPDQTAAPSTGAPASYSLQIIDETSGAPLAQAKVTIGDTEYESDNNGMIMLKSAPRRAGLKVEYGGSIIHTDAEFSAIPNRLNTVKVKPLYLDEDDLYAGNNASTRITGPEVGIGKYKFPVFDTPFDADYTLCKAVKVAYSADDKTFQVLIGGEGDLADIAVDANSTSWKKTLAEFKEEYNSAKNGSFDYTSNTGAPGTLGIKGSMDGRGFMEITLADGQSMQVSGGFVLKLTGNVSYTSYFAPPIYAVFSLSGEVGGTLKWELVNTSVVNPKMNFSGSINAGLTPQAGIGAGIKNVLSGEIGLSGTLATTYKFPSESLRDALKAELSASFYGTVVLLGFPFTNSQKFASVELYPDFGYFETVDIDEPDTYTIERKYLEDSELMAYDSQEGTIKSGLYPYSSVQTAALSDGSVLAVWTDDDTSRSGMDRTALYYSILKDEAWSEPEQINNDGTADYTFELSANGTKAAVVWQNAESTLSDDITVEENAEVTGLSYAVFDGSSWSEPVNLTAGNDGYEYSPSLYFSGTSGFVVWKENADNTVPPDADTKESIRAVTVSSDMSAGEIETKYEDLPLIYDLKVGSSGEIAYIVDKDGDYTTSDGELYIDGTITYSSDTTVSGLDFANGQYSFFDNGTLMKAIEGSAWTQLELDEGTEPRLIGDNAIVYEVNDGFTSNLYASYLKNSSWTKPLQITDFSEKLRSWDAWYNSDGTLGIAASAVTINTDSDELEQTARLVGFDKIAMPENIAVSYIESDDEIVRGSTASFDIGVTNDSTATSLTVTLSGETCGELYSGTVTANDVISVDVTIPDDFEKQTLTATVTGVSDETDLTDNSASAVFGALDLAVQLRGITTQKTGNITAVITNSSCEDAQNAVLTLTSDSGEAILTENIGSVAAGERKSVKLSLDSKYYTFDEEYGVSAVSAEITSDTEEDITYNNSSYYTFSPAGAESVRLDKYSVLLLPGEEYEANPQVYPSEFSDTEIYTLSSDETVATIDEDGTITAVGEGTAYISYMLPGSQRTTIQTVNVKAWSAPTISSVSYQDDGGDSISGTVTAYVNTSECLASGETETLIASVYASDGTLIGVTSKDVTASDSVSVYVTTSGQIPAMIQVMCWDSLDTIKPMSLAAEKTIALKEANVYEAVYTADDGDSVSGSVEISGYCSGSGTIIAAAYAEDGTLLGAQIQSASGSWSGSATVSTSGQIPETAKIMYWNGTDGMRPLLSPAVTDVTVSSSDTE